jgi:RHS repeat-associated protein
MKRKTLPLPILFAVAAAVCGSLPLQAATRPAPKDVPVPGEPVTVAVKKTQPVLAAATTSRFSLAPEVNGTADWGPVAFTYDKAGQITAIGSNTYAYDGVGRLAASTTNGVAESYTYDRYGNLTERTRGGVTIRFGIDPVNNRAGQPGKPSNVLASYDPYGNVVSEGTSSYTYDALNIAATGPSATYLYDADDERVATIVGNTYRYTLRGVDQKVLREVSNTAGTWSWSKDYIYRGAALLAEVTPAGTHHYHLDHLGSPRMVTDESTALRLATHDFFPFGSDTSDSTTDGQRLRFTGHERDLGIGAEGAGLDYMHARYYTAAWGRFLSVDPSMDLKKTLPNPQMWNRYAYVLNNPTRYTDPDGREHVQEPDFTKPLSEANGWDQHPSVSWAFNAESTLLSFAADEFLIGPAIGRAASTVTGFFRRPVLLGENMVRVSAGAKTLGAKIFGETGATFAETMTKNMKWLADQVKSGAKILDIGLDVARGGRTGVFYKAEVAFMEAAGYTRQFVKLVEVNGKTYRMFQWVPK